MNKIFLRLFLLGFFVFNPAVGHAEIKTTLLAGGCFWCLQHDMEGVTGVTKAQSGYAGGGRPNPTYDDYHNLDSSYSVPHLEVVEVQYDTAKITYSELLSQFLRKIDPTDGGGQFCDRGASYRPAIFVFSEQEKQQATRILAEIKNNLKKNIAVDVLASAPFWKAEEYHQDYAKKNPIQYKLYRYNCGRDKRVQEIWGTSPSKK